MVKVQEIKLIIYLGMCRTFSKFIARKKVFAWKECQTAYIELLWIV